MDSITMNERKHIEVVAAIILRERRIFATQRGYGEWKDWQEFTSGKKESRETPEDALRREIREELTTEIKVGESLTTEEYDYPKFHLTMHYHPSHHHLWSVAEYPHLLHINHPSVCLLLH